MEDHGNAGFASTTTQELEKFSPGMLNEEVTMKVVEKSFHPPVVGEKGSYSKIFLKLTSDDEARVRLFAFGRVAERANLECEEQSLVHFAGLEVVPIWRSDRHYGTVQYELKANANSTCSMVIPNYRPVNGMPFSKVADIETAPEFRRLKLKGQLLRDLVPYGTGLTGAVLLKDASGQREVTVHITTVAPIRKNAFRSGKPVVLKGSFKKFSSASGVVVRMTVESDTDVELVGEATLDKFVGNAGTSVQSKVGRSSSKPQANASTVRLSGSSSDSSGYDSSPSTSAQSAKRSCVVISGRLLHDFFRDEDGPFWGMVISPPEDNYEVRLNEVPDGAELLFREDTELTVHGNLLGYVLTVDRWADVDIEGGDAFQSVDEIPILSACDLRRQPVPLFCKTHAKILNFFVEGAQATITALAQDDEAKVILKITCLEVPSALRLYDVKGATVYATGMLESKGGYCVMSVSTASAVVLPDLGTADAEDVDNASAESAAPNEVPANGTPLKGKTGKGKSASSRARKRPAADGQDTPSKSRKPTTVKIEKPDDLGKYSNALQSPPVVVTLDADNDGQMPPQGAAPSTTKELSCLAVAPNQRVVPVKEPMSTRRTSRRGGAAKSKEDEKKSVDSVEHAADPTGAKNDDGAADETVSHPAIKPPTTLIHPGDISSESSDEEEFSMPPVHTST